MGGGAGGGVGGVGAGTRAATTAAGGGVARPAGAPGTDAPNTLGVTFDSATYGTKRSFKSGPPLKSDYPRDSDRGSPGYNSEMRPPPY